MKSGKCPKCHSEDIFEVPNHGTQDDRTIEIPITFFKELVVVFQRYLCLSCGYIERYAKRKSLSKLKAHLNSSL
jgi:predicted nucleic-acid-binding Zn-ribbon protein